LIYIKKEKKCGESRKKRSAENILAIIDGLLAHENALAEFEEAHGMEKNVNEK